MEIKEGVSKVNELLVSCPDALTCVLLKGENGSYYTWANNDINAKKVRKQAKEILEQVWQANATNFETLARMLRVSDLDIQAILDDEWRLKHGLK